MKNGKPYNPKRFEWKFYLIDPNLYFFQTYNQGPTLRACPEGLRKYLEIPEPFAHTSYEGSKKGWITTYLIKANSRELEDSAERYYRKVKIIKERKYFSGNRVDCAFNIFSRYINLDWLEYNFITMTRDDVHEFCHGKTAKVNKSGRHC